MASNVTVVGTDGFKFSRGFKMPNDENLDESGKDWIKWGKDNLACNFYNNIFYSSAYQSGIIRGKIHYITGSGFEVTKGILEDIDSRFGEFTTQDVIEAVCRDYELYNGFSIRVLRSLDGTKTYEHIDRDLLRYAKDLTGFWYSEDWSLSTQNETDTGLKFFPNYDPNGDEFDSMYVYDEKPKWKNIKANKKDARNVYPQPIYIGALKSLMTDIEIQSFHLYNIINGMKVSGALNFANGEPENKSQFEAAVQNAITPTENSGGILITYSDGDDRKMTWVPFTGDDLDKRYNILEKSVVQNIMSAHSVTSPALFGIKTDGQLGGSTEMQDSYAIFVRTYVRGRQKTIEDHFNYLLDDAAIQLNEPEPLDIGEKTAVVEPAPVATPIEQTFAQEKSVEDNILLSLMKCGRPKEGYSVLNSNDIDSEDFDFEATETSIKQSFLDGSQPDIKLDVLYSYELRPNAPALKGESREFCTILMQLGRLYTRQEIEAISLAVDRNVWLYRGGWYSDPTKPRPTPFCRHIWKQNLTVAKPNVSTEPPKDLTIDVVKNETIPNIIKDLKLENEDLKLSYGKIKGNVGGEVAFVLKGGKYVMGDKVRIDANKYKGNPEKLAEIIRHELRHVYQSKEMGFFVKDGFFYWKNEKYISIKDYNKILNKVSKAKTKEDFDKHKEEYNNLPWEMDANIYMKKMIFSSDVNYIDKVEDNGLIDLIELPEDLTKFNFSQWLRHINL
jgi:hypothetical protein